MRDTQEDDGSITIHECGDDDGCSGSGWPTTPLPPASSSTGDDGNGIGVPLILGLTLGTFCLVMFAMVIIIYQRQIMENMRQIVERVRQTPRHLASQLNLSVFAPRSSVPAVAGESSESAIGNTQPLLEPVSSP